MRLKLRGPRNTSTLLAVDDITVDASAGLFSELKGLLGAGCLEA